MSVTLEPGHSWWDRNRLHVLVRVAQNGATAFGDSVKLDDADARHRFAEQIAQHLNGSAPPVRELEAMLLALFDLVYEALAAAGEMPGAKEESAAARTMTTLVSEAQRRYRLVRTSTDEGFVVPSAGGAAILIRSRPFSLLLRRRKRELDREGESPVELLRDESIKQVIEELDAVAPDAPVETLHTRVAGSPGRVVIDMADADGRAIVVTPAGYEIVSLAGLPELFIRRPGQLTLPAPVHGGRLDDLWQYVNIPDAGDRALTLAWLVHALRDAHTRSSR